MGEEFKVGERLRSLRMDQEMSQETLALSAGISATYLGMLERGEKNPTIRVLSDLCKGLSVSLSDFFREEEEEQMDRWTEQILHYLHRRSLQEKEILCKIIQQIVKLLQD